MISVWFAVSFMFALGIVLDQVVLVITRSKRSPAGKVFVLTIVNFMFVMVTVAVAYFVDGFVVYGTLPDGAPNNGLLRWQIVIECFWAGYLWIWVASFWRFITEEANG